MWKLIKWLILILIVAGIVLWFTDVKVRGKSLKERYQQFKQTSLYQEGVKDMRVIVGEALKALGEEISGEVTDDERKQLENLIKKEMTPDNVPTKSEGNKTWQQQTLKPVPSKEAKPIQNQPAQ